MRKPNSFPNETVAGSEEINCLKRFCRFVSFLKSILKINSQE